MGKSILDWSFHLDSSSQSVKWSEYLGAQPLLYNLCVSFGENTASAQAIFCPPLKLPPVWRYHVRVFFASAWRQRPFGKCWMRTGVFVWHLIPRLSLAGSSLHCTQSNFTGACSRLKTGQTVNERWKEEEEGRRGEETRGEVKLRMACWY